jgi:hypothetical protein
MSFLRSGGKAAPLLAQGNASMLLTFNESSSLDFVSEDKINRDLSHARVGQARFI